MPEIDLHPDILKYLPPISQEEKTEVISKNNSLNEEHDGADLLNIVLESKEIIPSKLKDLSDGKLLAIRDINYFKLVYDLPTNFEKDRAHSSGLEIALNITKNLLKQSSVDDARYFLEECFSYLFKREQIKSIPLNDDSFQAHIQEINEAYTHALKQNIRSTNKDDDETIDSIIETYSFLD